MHHVAAKNWIKKMFAVYASERPVITPDQYIILDMDLQLTTRTFLHKTTTKTHTNI